MAAGQLSINGCSNHRCRLPWYNRLMKSTFEKSRVLVTGHTGFKGTWLSSALIQLGAEVVGASVDIPTNENMFTCVGLHDVVDDRRIDIRNYEQISNLIKEVDPDFVFHLAAQPIVSIGFSDPLTTWSTNVMGTINLLESIRRNTRSCIAVMVTSDKCYENKEWCWGYRENDKLGGKDPYSASKAAAEIGIESYVKGMLCGDKGIRVGIGRAGNVIGGGDWSEDRVVPDCIRAWRSGWPVTLRSPESTRPWQHVMEPVYGYLRLAEALYQGKLESGEAFNFGPSEICDYSVGTLVASMAEHWEGAEYKVQESNVSSINESNLLRLDCSKAYALLGWKQSYSLKQTAEETTSWYKQYVCGNGDMRRFTDQQISNYIYKAGDG